MKRDTRGRLRFGSRKEEARVPKLEKERNRKKNNPATLAAFRFLFCFLLLPFLLLPFLLLLLLVLQSSSSSSIFLPGVKQDVCLARLDGVHRDPLDVRVRGPEPGTAPPRRKSSSSGRSGWSVFVVLFVSFFATGAFNNLLLDSSSSPLFSPSVALGVVHAAAVGEQVRSLRFCRRLGPFLVVAAGRRSGRRG